MEIDMVNNSDSVVQDKNKRQFMRDLGTFIGAATAAQLLSGSALAVAMTYSPKTNSTDAPGKLFSQADMLTLRDICAQVIPKTETLGAAEVDVHGFIDNQLFHCFTKQEQQACQQILFSLNEQSKKRHARLFSQCSKAQQLSLLTDLEQTQNGFDATERNQFKMLKGLVIFGYYTSQEGATKELAYLQVPGPFKGSIPYTSVGKSWAPLGF